jgi:hypothetical protein
MTVESKWLALPDVRKVLLPMKAPLRLPVEPALCLWPPMHPEGGVTPFFSVPVEPQDGEVFSSVWIFSASNYLRLCSEEWVEIDLPKVGSRMDWLNRLIRV